MNTLVVMASVYLNAVIILAFSLCRPYLSYLACDRRNFTFLKSVFHDLHMRQPVLQMDSTDSILAQMGWVDADQEIVHCQFEQWQ